MEKNKTYGNKEMNDLDTFTINFITNGLDKLQDGIKDLRTSMDALESTFSDASTKGDTFFDKFTGWATKIAGVVGGIYGIRTAIRDTMNFSEKVLYLHSEADRVQRSAHELDTLSEALKEHMPINSDTIGEAAKFYDAINKVRTEGFRSSLSEDIIKELEYAHIGAFSPNDSDQQITKKIIQAIQHQTNAKDPGAIAKLMSSLGLSKYHQAFLSGGEEYVDKMLKHFSDLTYMSDPKTLQNSQNLHSARLELSRTYDKLSKQLEEPVTKLTVALTDLLKVMQPLIQDLIIGITKLTKKLTKWLGGDEDETKLSDVIKRLKEDEKIAKDPNNPFIIDISSMQRDVGILENNIRRGIQNTEENRKLLEFADNYIRDNMATERLAQGYYTDLNKKIVIDESGNRTFVVRSTEEINKIEQDRNARNAAMIQVMGY